MSGVLTKNVYVVACGECGAPMELKTSIKFKYPNGDWQKWYGCSRYPVCKGTHGAHPDGRPLGKPADAETKKARMAAHEALDRLVRAKGWGYGSRDRKATRKCYEWLGEKLGFKEEDVAGQVHISMFDKEICEKVVKIIFEATPDYNPIDPEDQPY